MKMIALVSLLILSGWGCSLDATAPDLAEACRPVVQVGGIVYEGTTLPEPAVVRAVPQARVERKVGCPDNPEARTVEPLQDGDSNFLPVGTTLHGVVGHPEQLAVHPEDRWIVLVAVDP